MAKTKKRNPVSMRAPSRRRSRAKTARGQSRSRTGHGRRALGDLTVAARGIDSALARGACEEALEELLAGVGTAAYALGTNQKDAKADIEKMKTAARRFRDRCILKGRS